VHQYETIVIRRSFKTRAIKLAQKAGAIHEFPNEREKKDQRGLNGGLVGGISKKTATKERRSKDRDR